jgi:hypothetical protein
MSLQLFSRGNSFGIACFSVRVSTNWLLFSDFDGGTDSPFVYLCSLRYLRNIILACYYSRFVPSARFVIINRPPSKVTTCGFQVDFQTHTISIPDERFGRLRLSLRPFGCASPPRVYRRRRQFEHTLVFQDDFVQLARELEAFFLITPSPEESSGPCS